MKPQLLGAILALIPSLSLALEMSHSLKSQTSYGTSASEWQQSDWRLDSELYQGLENGEITGILRSRFDLQDKLNSDQTLNNYSAHSEPLTAGDHEWVELRELYWQAGFDTSYWRIGKQQVVWGEADGIKLLDVINPQSYREFILDDFDDSRIPLWMVNGEFQVGEEGTLQALWVLDTSTHELAPSSSPFAFTSPVLVPDSAAVPAGVTATLEEANTPAMTLKNSDFGLRYTSFIGNWDFSLNYLYHYVDEAVISADLSGSSLTLTPDYKRSHLLGGSASSVFGDWVLRTEFAYETDRYHRTMASVPGVDKADQWGILVGLDYQGMTDYLISVQWFQSNLVGQTENLVKNRQENTLSLLVERTLFNETLLLKWLHLHSTDHGDGVVQPQISYNLESDFDVFLGMDIFYGNEGGLYGQFDEADRISAGFEWGF